MLVNLRGVSVTAIPRKDGRYQGYAVQNGEKRYFYGRSREEVTIKIENFLSPKAIKSEQKRGSSPPLGEFVRTWIEIYKKPNLKPTSLLALEISLKPALKNFADRAIAEISADELQKFLLGIKAERLRDMCRDRLNQVFQKAMTKGLIKSNPCNALELKRHKYAHKFALTPEEEQRFFTAIRLSKYYTLCRLLSTTGVRIGEALALRRSDIDVDSQTVSITKNIVFVDGKRIEQNSPKTAAGYRTIPLPNDLCARLAETKTDTLFPYTYNAVRLFLERTGRALNMKVSAHIFRHTYATRLEEAGIRPKIKQYLLGHATLHMTENVYTDTQKQYVDSESVKVRAIFENKL